VSLVMHCLGSEIGCHCQYRVGSIHWPHAARAGAKDGTEVNLVYEVSRLRIFCGWTRSIVAEQSRKVLVLEVDLKQQEPLAGRAADARPVLLPHLRSEVLFAELGQDDGTVAGIGLLRQRRSQELVSRRTVDVIIE
jgi:hypothetical protein